ncbi:hypothetical protein ASZ90_003883 [hydrocarbon metagenome]|uniref:Schlafen AlbA-2 domain-containing protein n=1 Tax=hydrocarbon metagenome TaxID=938273 RepID=A0A0W8FZJ9_9ZZZZ
MLSEKEILQLLNIKEDSNLEFKKAEESYSFDKLSEYSIALANENGGKLILGITDKLPRQIIGTNAFRDIIKIEKSLYDKLHLRIDVIEKEIQGKRILIFDIPSRPIGKPLEINGKYLMRVGDSLIPMTSEQIQKIHNERILDYSAEICESATIEDLSEEAIEEFRKLWYKKSQNQKLLSLPVQQLLKDAELIYDTKITYAALILLGKKYSLGRYLANSEVIFEYRSREEQIESGKRIDFRDAFFNIYDKIWETINLRNEVEHIQEGLFIRDIPNFNEEVVRESILNAVCHRDYTLPGSTFIKQFPHKLIVENPGGFLPGINPDNIIYEHAPRNRRIAEVFQKCGLVERSGQGADKIFENSISEGKAKPDYSGSDDYKVQLILNGQVKDKQFIRFLEKVSDDKNKVFSIDELLLLDDIREGIPVSDEFKKILENLKSLGIIEVIGRGKGTKYILSHKYYEYINKKGIYTRKRGLENYEKRELILKHLRQNHKATREEINQIFPDLTRDQIYNLLRKLRKDYIIEFISEKGNLGFWQIKK